MLKFFGSIKLPIPFLSPRTGAPPVPLPIVLPPLLDDEGPNPVDVLILPSLPGKTFQNLSVSSPAPVTIVSPSGDIARYSTLSECPVKVATFFIEGYFQTTIAFSEYPCVLTNSFTFFEKSKLHTYEPVSILWISCMVWVSQNLIHLSAVPPPDASRPFWSGDQAIALTAALWLWNLPTGSLWLWDGDQTNSLLSFPPEASC